MFRKGKKVRVHNCFKKALMEHLKDKNMLTNINNKIEKTAELLTPYIGVTVKRKGRKNILYPKYLNERQGLFLFTNWLLKSVKEKSNRNFYKNLLNEITSTLSETGTAINKKKSLYNQVLDNMYKVKVRRRYRKKNFKKQKNNL